MNNRLKAAAGPEHPFSVDLMERRDFFELSIFGAGQ
jgi:hypothetical protein